MMHFLKMSSFFPCRPLKKCRITPGCHFPRQVPTLLPSWMAALSRGGASGPRGCSVNGRALASGRRPSWSPSSPLQDEQSMEKGAADGAGGAASALADHIKTEVVEDDWKEVTSLCSYANIWAKPGLPPTTFCQPTLWWEFMMTDETLVTLWFQRCSLKNSYTHAICFLFFWLMWHFSAE